MMAANQPIVLSAPGPGLGGRAVGVTFIRSTEQIKPSLASSILHKPFGTTAVVPTSGVISGISPDVGEYSVLPKICAIQTHIQRLITKPNNKKLSLNEGRKIIYILR